MMKSVLLMFCALIVNVVRTGPTAGEKEETEHLEAPVAAALVDGEDADFGSFMFLSVFLFELNNFR